MRHTPNDDIEFSKAEPRTFLVGGAALATHELVPKNNESIVTHWP